MIFLCRACVLSRINWMILGFIMDRKLFYVNYSCMVIYMYARSLTTSNGVLSLIAYEIKFVQFIYLHKIQGEIPINE